MSNKLRESLEVLNLAMEIIESTPAHKHLKLGKPNIVCLLRDGPWQSKGKSVWAKVYKADPKTRAISDVDIFLVVNEPVWSLLDADTRKALIDHELCHIAWATTPGGDLRTDDEGRPVWTLVSHDYEDFIGVIKRHGVWTTDAKRFLKAASKYTQMGLFEETQEVPEDSSPDPDEYFYISFDEQGRPIFTVKETKES